MTVIAFKPLAEQPYEVRRRVYGRIHERNRNKWVLWGTVMLWPLDVAQAWAEGWLS